MRIANSILVPIDQVVENEWNPNEQDEITFNELTSDIENDEFDEPLQVVEIKKDDPLYQQGYKYKVIGGEHRLKAVKVLGWSEIPIVIKNYESEEIQKIKTVRRNMLRGKNNRAKFTQLVHSLNRRQDIDLALEMGFSSKESLMTAMLNEKGIYDPDMAQEINKIKKEELAIRNLSMILNKLFAEFGETVQNSYMFFTYGTKLHLMIMMSPKLRKSIDILSQYCQNKNTDINEVLEKIVEEGSKLYRG